MLNDIESQKRNLLDYLVKLGFLRTRSVIEAFIAVNREDFVPAIMRKYAYDNEPLPIGHGQTISQPLTVAAMTEALEPRAGMKILEVGAGSGYQAAILAHIVGETGRVVTTERLPALVGMARRNLADENIRNVDVIEWDGTRGYEKEAPYDRIIVTATAPSVPQPLIEQLKPCSRMVVPVEHKLLLVTKKAGKLEQTSLGNYLFVPLVGKFGFKE